MENEELGEDMDIERILTGDDSQRLPKMCINCFHTYRTSSKYHHDIQNKLFINIILIYKLIEPKFNCYRRVRIKQAACISLWITNNLPDLLGLPTGSDNNHIRIIFL